MALSVDWNTKVILVPQADLTVLGPSLYELDVDAFRLELKAIEAGDGMPFLDTHRHFTEVTLSGVTYARIIEIINGYTVEFEDGQYTVVAVGANHNLADVKVANQVSLVTQNSAGLVSTATPEDIRDAVFAKDMEGGITFDLMQRIIAAVVAGKVSGAPSAPVFRNLSDTQDQVSGDADPAGNRITATYGT